MFLEAHFGEVELYIPEGGDEREQGEENNEPLLVVRLDEAEAHVDLLTLVSTSLSSLCTDALDYVILIFAGSDQRQ
jgi:cleavage and polyadenylation specificity factor subunit 3